jgi:hypothetical protein
MSVTENKTIPSLFPAGSAERMSVRGFHAGTIERMRFKVTRSILLGSREVNFGSTKAEDRKGN